MFMVMSIDLIIMCMYISLDRKVLVVESLILQYCYGGDNIKIRGWFDILTSLSPNLPEKEVPYGSE